MKGTTQADLYISEKALKSMLSHCAAHRDERLEVMGFMLGDRYKWNGEFYTKVVDTATTELDATSVSVRFARDAFERLFEELEERNENKIIVGWYHSHPGHGCFMSGTDLATQKEMFNKPFHFAAVIDPVNMDMRAYALDGEECVERRYAIFSSDCD